MTTDKDYDRDAERAFRERVRARIHRRLRCARVSRQRSIRRVVVLSDLHVGSVYGLWPGTHKIEGGGDYSASVFQAWLWQCWQRMLDEVEGLSPAPDVILNGDAIQGVNKRDGELCAANTGTQVKVAAAVLKRLRAAARRFYMVRGTEWHDGAAAEDLELLATGLKAQVDPQTEMSSWWELYYDIGGPVIHFAHHVGCSSVPWYEATVPLRDTLLQMSELHRFYGDRAPNLRMVVRSHRHRNIEVKAPPDIHAVVTPAWQLKNAFGYKKAASMLPQIGYLIIEWDGQDLMVRDRIFDLPELHVEVAR